MTDREALLAAVLQSPDDDTPRLMFADWCEENGETERAEFIRVQIEASRCVPCGGSGVVSKGRSRFRGVPLAPGQALILPGDAVFQCEGCSGALRRERELFEQSPQTHVWFGAVIRLAKMGSDWYEHLKWFSRGFIDPVTCSWSDWLANEKAIRREHPVRMVRLTSRDPYFFDGGESDAGGRCLRVGPNEWTCEKFPGIVFVEPPNRVQLRRSYLFTVLPMDRFRQLQDATNTVNAVPFGGMPAGSLRLEAIEGRREEGEGYLRWRVDARFGNAPATARALADFDALFADGEELIAERSYEVRAPDAR